MFRFFWQRMSHALRGRRYSRLIMAVLLALFLLFSQSMILTVHASSSAQATPPPPTIAPWSKSGSYVDFKGNAVFLVANGKRSQVATDNAKLLDPLFTHLAMVSPDGHWLLYVTAQDRRWKNASLNLVNLSTLQKSHLKTFPASFWPQVRWSPDSKQIAYVLVNARTDLPEIYVLGINGGNAQKIVSATTFTKKSLEGYEQAMFGWSADSQNLMYYDNALTPGKVYTVSVAAKGSSSQALTSTQAKALVANTAPNTVCNAPIFNQTSYSDIMQTGGDSIAAAGCALTSATMMVDYYAGTTVYTPPSMNSCMGNYADPLYWGVVASNCSQGRLTTGGVQGFSWGTLNTELSAGHPTIVGITWNSGGTHYFLVVSGDGSSNPANYVINDPGYGARHALSDITNIAQLDWIIPYQPTSGNWPACTGGSSGGGGSPPPQGSGSAASTTLVTYPDGSKDLFAVSSDGRMWHNWTGGAESAWIGWNWWSNSGMFANAAPTLVTYADGSKDLFAIGSDGRMWHNWTSGAEGNWIGWNWWSNNSGMFASAAPTLITYTDGSMDLIAVGADGRMWHNWTGGAESAWIGWNWWSNNTVFANATPTLITYADGSKDLIAVATDGRMWHNWTSGAEGNWIGWNWWSDLIVFADSSPTLITYTDGSKDIIAVGADGRMWHNWTGGAENAWIGWNWWSNNTVFTNAAPTLVTYADGSKDLFAVSSDGRMWHNWTGGAESAWIGWNWWSNSGVFTNASSTLITYTDGSMDLIAVGSDGRMWHNWTGGAESAWIGWNWWSNNTGFV